MIIGFASTRVAAEEAALVGVDAVREEPYKRTVEVIGRLAAGGERSAAEGGRVRGRRGGPPFLDSATPLAK